MPTLPSDLFEAVQVRIGGKLTPSERRLLELERYPGDYEKAEAPGDRDDAAMAAEALVLNLREAGRWEGSIRVGSPRDTSSEEDQRWQLLRDLGLLPQGPVEARGTSSELIVSDGVFDRVSYVDLRFDSRLSKSALIAQLNSLWPDFKTAGWVRPTRSLKPRKLALVRFVCLESDLADTWRERLRRWNSLHPDWAYTEARAMQSDFHRAEKSLTGRKWGLAWYYHADRHAAAAVRTDDPDSMTAEDAQLVVRYMDPQFKAALAQMSRKEIAAVSERDDRTLIEKFKAALDELSD